jgi:hypothetical protein
MDEPMTAHTTGESMRASIGNLGRTRSARLSMAMLSLAFACGLLNGCSSMRYRVGEPLDLPALERLQVGVSTAEEISTALGPPYGTGRAQLPFHPAPREMWTYYYEIGSLIDGRRTFLFVFLDEGILDGYTWLSSLPAETRAPGAPAPVVDAEAILTRFAVGLPK